MKFIIWFLDNFIAYYFIILVFKFRTDGLHFVLKVNNDSLG